MEEEKFRQKIKSSTRDNIMNNVNEYIEWNVSNKSTSIVAALEFSLVSCRNFEATLSKDIHYMNLWCRYADCFPNPNDIYQKIYDKHLFRKLADFYVRWVEVLLKGDQLNQVLNVFSKAVANDCVPMEKIRERAKQFKTNYKDSLSSIVQKRNMKIMFYSNCATDNDETNNNKLMNTVSMEEIKAVNYCVNKLGKHNTQINYEKDIEMVPVWIGLLEDKQDPDVTMDVTTGLLSINCTTLYEDTHMTDSPVVVAKRRKSMLEDDSITLSYMNDLSAITLANHTERSFLDVETTKNHLATTLLAQEAKEFVANCFSQPSLYDHSVYEPPKHLDGVGDRSAFSIYADNSTIAKPPSLTNQPKNYNTKQSTPYFNDKGVCKRQQMITSIANYTPKQPHYNPTSSAVTGSIKIKNQHEDSVNFKSILSTQMTSTPFVFRTTTSSGEESGPNTYSAATTLASTKNYDNNQTNYKQSNPICAKSDNAENIAPNSNPNKDKDIVTVCDHEKTTHYSTGTASATIGVANQQSPSHRKTLPCITTSLNDLISKFSRKKPIEIFNKKVQLEIIKKITPHIKYYEGFHHFADDTPFKIDIGKTFCYENEKWLVESFIGEGGFASVFLVRTTFSKNAPQDSSKIKRNSWKIQNNALFGIYEFYACREVGRRIHLKAPHMCSYFMNPRSIIVTPAKSILIYCYYKAFSLLDVCNRLKQQSDYQLSESVVLTIFKKLLEIISTLHECHFIHGDIKPDNILLMDPTTNNKKDDWMVSLKLIDFGRCIDISLFDACDDVQFCGRSYTQDFECIEMIENKPWKFSVDVYGIVATIHVLIFKNYMSPYKMNNDDGSFLWKITNSVKRSWDRNFWKNLFDVTLNHGSGINRKTCSNLLTQVIKKMHDFSEDQIDLDCREFLKKLF